MDELSQHAKDQLRLAKRGLTPQASDRERIHGALVAALAVGAATATQAAAAQAAATQTTAAAAQAGTQMTAGSALVVQKGLVGKAVVAMAFAASVGGTVGYQLGYQKAEQQHAKAPVALEAPLPVAQREVAPIAPVAAIAAEVPAAPATTPLESATEKSQVQPVGAMAQAAPIVPVAPGTSPEAEEILQLERVQRALRDGRPALALAILTELDQKVPRGRLHEERSAARVIARCSMGESSSKLTGAFSNRYPGSMYAERIAAACAAAREKSPASATELPSSGQD